MLFNDSRENGTHGTSYYEKRRLRDIAAIGHSTSSSCKVQRNTFKTITIEISSQENKSDVPSMKCPLVQIRLTQN